MMSKVVEIPVGKRSARYRFFEILPFALSIGVVLQLELCIAQFRDTIRSSVGIA